MPFFFHVNDDETGLQESVHTNFKPQSDKIHLSNEKNPGCLGYIGDYTIQLHRDFNKPL